MKRVLSTASMLMVFALGATASRAADGISGTWSSGAGPGEQTFVFRVQGNTFVGIVCGPCDDPTTAARIADGRIVDAQHVTFIVDRDQRARDQVSATLSGTELTLQTRREGGADARGTWC